MVTVAILLLRVSAYTRSKENKQTGNFEMMLSLIGQTYHQLLIQQLLFSDKVILIQLTLSDL
jgi:hypothetical protein